MFAQKTYTVQESRARLSGKRKEIYDYILDTWIAECYVPPLRAISETLFIPLATLAHHVKKLVEADLLYKIEGTETFVLRGAITSIDLFDECHPVSTAYRKQGGQPAKSEDEDGEQH